MGKYTKAVLLIVASWLSTLVSADDQYQKKINCIAAYSLAREIAFDTGNIKRFKELTAAQNEIFVAHPIGYFKRKHIDNLKLLYKQTIERSGPLALNTLLADCGREKNESEKATGKALDAMTTRITRSWRRPLSFQGGLEVYIRMSLASTGQLVSVHVVESSGDLLFDLSGLRAVQRAAPFDEVKQLDASTFEEKFRTLTVKFRPED